MKNGSNKPKLFLRVKMALNLCSAGITCYIVIFVRNCGGECGICGKMTGLHKNVAVQQTKLIKNCTSTIN